MSVCQRVFCEARPLVSKRSPATIMYAWLLLAKIVTHWPLPGSPQLSKPVESIDVASSPAPWKAYDSEPEQSYPESSQRPWPPPYLYGLVAMRLPAATIALTTGGAEAGAGGSPSRPTPGLSGRAPPGGPPRLLSAGARRARGAARGAPPATPPGAARP